MTEFEKELGELIRKHSMEHESDTPEFILAKYLIGCLESFNEAMKQRDSWYRTAEK